MTDGFRAARGEIAGYIDVDLEVHSRYIPSLVRAIEQGADVATVRRIYAFQLAVARPLLHEPRLLVPGAPAARRELRATPRRATSSSGASKLLPLLDEIEDPGWFWDTEFMVRAARRGLAMVEIPGAYVRRKRQDLDRAAACATRCATSAQLVQLPAQAAGGRVKALDEIGWRRALRFGFFTAAMVPYRMLLVPQLRAPWLRLLGARVGARAILHDVRFFNLYRRGLAGLEIGDECFLGDECLLDLAEGVRLEAQVTLAERVLVLTHTNVGYADHPLQARFPASAAPVVIERGSFVGANVTLLPGVRIGAGSFVAAGSVVTEDVPKATLVAGVPARVVRPIA